MKKYINFNIEKEQMLVIVLKNIFLKLMINSVCQFWQNNGKRKKIVSVRLVSNEKDCFNKHLAAVHEIKPVLTLKPIYVGFTVLELMNRNNKSAS